MNNIIYYPIIVEKINDEDGHYFVATSPNINGMVTDGDTFEEVSNNAIDAIETVIDGDQHIPKPEDPDKWDIKANEKIVYVPVSPYKWIKDRQKTIRKTITVPKYLSDLAKEKKVNVSKIATEALKERLEA